jgi:hypothetical protein
VANGNGKAVSVFFPLQMTGVVDMLARANGQM